MSLKPNRFPTPFQKRVYRAARKIPRGRVTTYKILADYISATGSLTKLGQVSACGRKCRSYRAIGQALRRNPFAPHVPCHRVIASDLTPGGFKGHKTGMVVRHKLKLLQSEGILFRNEKLANPDLIYRFHEKKARIQ